MRNGDPLAVGGALPGKAVRRPRGPLRRFPRAEILSPRWSVPSLHGRLHEVDCPRAGPSVPGLIVPGMVRRTAALVRGGLSPVCALSPRWTVPDLAAHPSDAPCRVCRFRGTCPDRHAALLALTAPGVEDRGLSFITVSGLRRPAAISASLQSVETRV